MNAWLVTAAAGLGAVGVAHSYLGERYLLIRLFRRTDLPRVLGSEQFTKRTLRFAWHLTTVAWWGAAAMMLAVGAGSPRLAVQLLSATFLVSALVALGASRGRHLSWLVFLGIAVAAWLGAPTI
ncbi:hypothetical protein [Gemmatimonas sp.]|uniref:hypothetical protein n=1 Tax=Gemmatimonas sp. TaxID=1962908 RepID=UPI00286B8B05|nr:hypothetical protein [Gemmatimonas sp.]